MSKLDQASVDVKDFVKQVRASRLSLALVSLIFGVSLKPNIMQI